MSFLLVPLNVSFSVPQGRRLVIVDGVGYPGVGSCVGCSNAQVASALGAPVVLVGRPGIGNAIDSTVMAVDYLSAHGVSVVGALWNKIPRKVTYHTYDRCKEYVAKFFSTYTPKIEVFGHVPLLRDKDGNEEEDSGSCKISCSLRKPSKVALTMTADDVDRSTRTCAHFLDYVDVARILTVVKKYYTTPSSAQLGGTSTASADASTSTGASSTVDASTSTGPAATSDASTGTVAVETRSVSTSTPQVATTYDASTSTDGARDGEEE